MTTNNHRVIYYAFLESALRFREGFWREDLEAFEQGIWNYHEKVQAKSNEGFSKRRKRDAEAKALILDYKRKDASLHKSIERLIVDMESNLSPDMKVKFDNYVAGWGLLADELMQAKNTTELLTVCKLYNSGALDGMLQGTDELNRKYENIPDQSLEE